MGVLISIALRNLKEHRAKTLIIGVIITIGVMAIILGGAFLDQAEVGIKKAFTQNFTGDVYVYGKVPGKLPAPVSILFSNVSMSGDSSETPLLPDYNSLSEYVASQPRVAASAGLVTTMALFNQENKGEVGAEQGSGAMLGGAIIMGIDPDSYRKVFDNIVVKEGHYLASGETGLMLSSKVVRRMERAIRQTTPDPVAERIMDIPGGPGEDGAPRIITVGSSLMLQGISNNGFNMRKATVVGIFDSKSESEANDYMAFADVNTVRLLASLTVGGAAEVALPESAKALASVSNEDDVFAVDEEVAGGSGSSELQAVAAEAASAPKPAVSADSGAWQFLVLKLKNPSDSGAEILALNAYFQAHKIDAVAGDWKGAGSPFSNFVDLVRLALIVVILIVAVVAIFVIMNTLVVSVIERTGEIGTIRALGGQKSFVWKMFLIETLCITLVFGAVGVLFSGVAMAIVNAVGIKATNTLLTIVFGGPVLKLSLSAAAVAGTLVMVTLVSLIAHIYPVRVALRIQPVRAMQAE